MNTILNSRRFCILLWVRAGNETAQHSVPRLSYWKRNMGVKNYLIDGVSCAGKTTVCDELQRRGYHAIHGDEELAYWGDPKTGEPVDGSSDEHRTWMWDVEKVRALVADQNHAATFFCGGSRNSDRFIGLFDEVFVLEIDLDTLNRRLAARPETEWGGTASEGESFARLQHATKEGLPTNAIIIDATAPLSSIVDTILACTIAALARNARTGRPR
jgi:gluconate kinase